MNKPVNYYGEVNPRDFMSTPMACTPPPTKTKKSSTKKSTKKK